MSLNESQMAGRAGLDAEYLQLIADRVAEVIFEEVDLDEPSVTKERAKKLWETDQERSYGGKKGFNFAVMKSTLEGFGIKLEGNRFD